MYTHLDWTRRGVGRFVLSHCEQEAKKAGFKRVEMTATLAGIPLYETCGYEKIDGHIDIAEDGTSIPSV